MPIWNTVSHTNAVTEPISSVSSDQGEGAVKLLKRALELKSVCLKNWRPVEVGEIPSIDATAASARETLIQAIQHCISVTM